jgi:hypothetical protein
VAYLATFLAAYHAWFIDLYYSSGTVYDLLCFAFYFAAFNWYVTIRQQNRLPAAREFALLLVSYICALNAKEMAVTLPVFIFFYEVLYHWPQIRREPRQIFAQSWYFLATAFITAVYTAGKLTGPGRLTENAAYHLSISASRFLDTFHLYLNPFLYQINRFHDANTIQFLLIMLAISLALRSRCMTFAWLFLLLSELPVSFVAHYSAFFLYVPMAGWALYAASLLRFARKAAVAGLALFTKQLRPRIVPVTLTRCSQVLLALVLALLLAPLHARESRKTLRNFRKAQPPTRDLTFELRNLKREMPRGARILFVNDPFPHDDYFLPSLTQLVYGDLSIKVHRTAIEPAAPAEYGRYTAVFFFKGQELSQVRKDGG